MDDDPKAVAEAPVSERDARVPSPENAQAPMDARRKIVLLTVLAISIWHIGAIVVWMAPSSSVRDSLARTMRKYTRITKTDQNWAMFAPDPLSINRKVIVRAELAPDAKDPNEPATAPEIREIDLTGPVNRAMRSFSFERVGKRLKAHDRVLAGDEPQYLHGFVQHTCVELSEKWGRRVARVTLFREWQSMSVDVHTLKTTRSAVDRANLGTYDCVE